MPLKVQGLVCCEINNESAAFILMMHYWSNASLLLLWAKTWGEMNLASLPGAKVKLMKLHLIHNETVLWVLHSKMNLSHIVGWCIAELAKYALLKKQDGSYLSNVLKINTSHGSNLVLVVLNMRHTRHNGEQNSVKSQINNGCRLMFLVVKWHLKYWSPHYSGIGYF